MKASEFVQWAYEKVGCYYWYGTFGQKASKQLYNEKKNQYPKYYTASDYESQIANPKQCYDCAGLVKSKWVYPKYNAADDLGATGLYGKCTIKGVLDPKTLKPGMLLFKGNDKTKTHVGIYTGDNNQIIEAKGHAYGVIISTLNDSWKYQAEYYNVDYAAEDISPEPSPEPVTTICKHSLIVNTIKDPLMLRDGPGTKYPVLYRMPKGSIVEWSGVEQGDWLKVKYQKVTGWAHKEYLKIC